MPDIIKLLPDSVANQIAAGEVVQRPASVVKELLENSIDSGASDIKLIVKDAGRTLIQVSDNGKGMSETDARMCFERHATSKINQAQDLFALRTMGFRGEAMASIASIARVELKTRTEEDALGSEVIIEGSQVISQQPCQCPKGTSVAVKNLFFNTPARRNFLKNDNVEKNHIFNEFVRVALPYPNISFSYYHNNQIVLQADTGNLSQRIVNLFGSNYKSRLVPVTENTEIVKISGYLLKPEYARKKRGEQYFFVNNRFIRSSYLNHAVENGYSELISDDSYPSFFILIEIDPTQIDVNVHPTKTEIKFQDDRIIYQIIKAAVKRSLGKFNIMPALDFERETAFDNIHFDKNKAIVPPVIAVNPDFNPFEEQIIQQGKNLNNRSDSTKWDTVVPQKITSFFTSSDIDELMRDAHQQQPRQTLISPDWGEEAVKNNQKKFIHLHNRYIISLIKSGLMIMDQQRVHERILYEKHLRLLQNKKSHSQTLLFPEQIRLSDIDSQLIREMQGDIAALGFSINELGKNIFVIDAIPSELPENENLQGIIESILDNFKKNKTEIKLDTTVNLARSLARSLSVKSGKPMNDDEMNALADALFSCEMPHQSPSGKPTLVIITLEEIMEKFK